MLQDDPTGAWNQYFKDKFITISDNQIAMFTFFGSISLIASIFVTISIFTVPKLRAHPNIMIGFISLFESISWYVVKY